MSDAPEKPKRKPLTIFMFEDVKRAIDQARGVQPRSIWIEKAAKEKLKRDRRSAP